MTEPAEPIRRFYADWSQYRSLPRQVTADKLEVEFERRLGDIRQLHTRRSILLRLLSHDAFHSGEISQLLGANGLPAIDLWARR